MGAHVCPPLRLTNTDIRLVVCTAWVMWHQSDLQNSRGGAINHIGSGINHCVEDIFCHRCSLTITLRKTLAPLPPPRPFLFSSIAPSATRATTDWSQEEEEKKRAGVLSTTRLKCRLKFIESPVCQPSEMPFSRESRRQWRHCFEINLKTSSFISQPSPPSLELHLYDNCQFYFRIPTIGTRLRARNGEEEVEEEVCLIY